VETDQVTKQRSTRGENILQNRKGQNRDPGLPSVVFPENVPLDLFLKPFRSIRATRNASARREHLRDEAAGRAALPVVLVVVDRCQSDLVCLAVAGLEHR
jgi:hypothetical protein